LHPFHVYAEHLEWIPRGPEQLQWYAHGWRPTFANPKHVLLTLYPGQRLAFRALAHATRGGEHASASAVSTVSHRFQSEVQLRGPPIRGQLAMEVRRRCAYGVFDEISDIEDLGDLLPPEAYERAVLRVRKDGGAEACVSCFKCVGTLGLAPPNSKGPHIRIRRDPLTAIFTLRSRGALMAREILSLALSLVDTGTHCPEPEYETLRVMNKLPTRQQRQSEWDAEVADQLGPYSQTLHSEHITESLRQTVYMSSSAAASGSESHTYTHTYQR
jgi:hypothetical protein